MEMDYNIAYQKNTEVFNSSYAEIAVKSRTQPPDYETPNTRAIGSSEKEKREVMYFSHRKGIACLSVITVAVTIVFFGCLLYAYIEIFKMRSEIASLQQNQSCILLELYQLNRSYEMIESRQRISDDMLNQNNFTTLNRTLTQTGVTYIRWGRTSCPDTEETEVLYQGKAAGKFYDHVGGGSNYLCLTDDPVPLPFTAGGQTHRTFIYGAEYEIRDSPPALGSNHDFNVPCVACYSSVRSTKIMIPGTMNCSSSWTREYYGYLMAEQFTHESQMSYECVDVNAEKIEGTGGNAGGAYFYFTEIMCNGISCPPYQAGMEVSCVVCTK